MTGKVTSICAASGWWAGYTGESDPYFHRVVVFALVEDEDNPRVLPVDTLDISQGYGEISKAENFRGVFHETEFEIVGEVLNLAGKTRFDAEAR